MNSDATPLETARAILRPPPPDLALLIGNGINLAGGAAGVGWTQLIQGLIAFAAERSSHPHEMAERLKRLTPPQKEARPASLPEVFDIIAATMDGDVEPRAKRSAEALLQDKALAALRGMQPGTAHQALANWAVDHDAPVLTTNYDQSIEEGCGARRCRQFRTSRTEWNSDYYPWDRYYSVDEVSDPGTGFAVWHVHGDQNYGRSLRLGLDQYMGMVQRLRGLVGPIAKESLAGVQIAAEGLPAFRKAPWLRVFLGKRLWIQGLELGADEVAVRWLLIQRFRYWRRLKPSECRDSGWYVHGPVEKTGTLPKERRVFLESVGLNVIEIERAANVYVDLFAGGDSQEFVDFDSAAV